MSNKQQTAVEWLSEQFDSIVELYPSQFERVNRAIEQAKEMEKEQIVKGVNFGTNQWGGWGVLNGEEYYNETYGGNK
jgi:hypothetical protein